MLDPYLFLSKIVWRVLVQCNSCVEHTNRSFCVMLVALLDLHIHYPDPSYLCIHEANPPSQYGRSVDQHISQVDRVYSQIVNLMKVVEERRDMKALLHEDAILRYSTVRYKGVDWTLHIAARTFSTSGSSFYG